MQRTEHSCGQGPRRATCVQLGVCDECVSGYYKCVFCSCVTVVFAIVGVPFIFKKSSYKANLYGNTNT